MSDLPAVYQTDFTLTGTSCRTADELAEELHREIIRLNLDRSALLTSAGGNGRARVASLVLSAIGAGIGRRVLRTARRTPLPFAAAISGASWLAVAALTDRSDEGAKPENRGFRRKFAPALGLMLCLGAFIGARVSRRAR